MGVYFPPPSIEIQVPEGPDLNSQRESSGGCECMLLQSWGRREGGKDERSRFVSTCPRPLRPRLYERWGLPHSLEAGAGMGPSR
eukprot:1705238-Pyramimonas_sp.AAC.1